MWQITMLFSWLPDWFWYAVLVLGLGCLAAAWFLGKLPLIAGYRFGVQLVGIISTVVSIWFLGAASNEAVWQQRIREVEAKLEQFKLESAAINDKLRAEQAEKAKLAEQKNKTVIQYVDKFRDREVLKTVEGPERVRIEKVIEYVEKCPVPKELLDAHNAAAKREALK